MPIGGVAARGLFVARGDGAELLYFREEVFDQVPPSVGVFVVVTLDLAVRLWWDDCARTPRVQFCKQPIGIKRLVRQKGVKGDVLDQRCHAFQVVSLAGQQNKVEQVAQGIDQGHDLRGQSAAGAPDGLSLSPPFAPLAFW